jgi:hypothetical protein
MFASSRESACLVLVHQAAQWIRTAPSASARARRQTVPATGRRAASAPRRFCHAPDPIGGLASLWALAESCLVREMGESQLILSAKA